MEVGVTMAFQNPGNGQTDSEIYRQEVAMALQVEGLGYDSIWTTEHHFTDYEMCPSPMQFLTFMAGASQRLKLGSMVVVVPWHDPYRIAAEVTMLENLSGGGRLMLGLGRGLARVEMDRFDIADTESRTRLTEHATAILESLETGVFELDGTHHKQISSPLKPSPPESFRGRAFIAGQSPETAPFAASVGAGMLVIPVSSWDDVVKNLGSYEASWSELRPTEPRPRPVAVVFVYVDEDPDRAKEMAYEHMDNYWRSAMTHYGMTEAGRFSKLSGNEHWKAVNESVSSDLNSYVRKQTDMMVFGTPAQVTEQLADLRKLIDMSHMVLHFTFATLPFEDAERSMRLFASDVLPEIHSWQVDTHVPV